MFTGELEDFSLVTVNDDKTLETRFCSFSALRLLDFLFFLLCSFLSRNCSDLCKFWLFNGLWFLHNGILFRWGFLTYWIRFWLWLFFDRFWFILDWF